MIYFQNGNMLEDWSGVSRGYSRCKTSPKVDRGLETSPANRKTGRTHPTEGSNMKKERQVTVCCKAVPTPSGSTLHLTLPWFDVMQRLEEQNNTSRNGQKDIGKGIGSGIPQRRHGTTGGLGDDTE